MKKISFLTICATLLLITLGLSSCGGSDGNSGEYVLVANRASGSFTVINIKTNDVKTYSLPGGDSVPEPMYIVYSPQNKRVYIGDRANKRLVVYKVNEYTSPITFVDVGAGIFHMWGEQAHNQLWVNNDIDKTISVVDMLDASVITTIPIPEELLSGKPHDVILDPNAPFSYVTLLGVDGESDYVLKYSTETFKEVNRVAVGNIPHVSLSDKNDTLYVPTQGGNGVSVIERSTFKLITKILIDNAHGGGMSANGRTFFTTNIAQGGVGGLVSVDTSTNSINSKVDTPLTVPHNIVLSSDQRQLFLSHSGNDNNMVTVWDVSDPKEPVFLKAVPTEFNPYGIVIVTTP